MKAESRWNIQTCEPKFEGAVTDPPPRTTRYEPPSQTSYNILSNIPLAQHHFAPPELRSGPPVALLHLDTHRATQATSAERACAARDASVASGDARPRHHFQPLLPPARSTRTGKGTPRLLGMRQTDELVESQEEKRSALLRAADALHRTTLLDPMTGKFVDPQREQATAQCVTPPRCRLHGRNERMATMQAGRNDSQATA
jgi:hypothetical protein